MSICLCNAKTRSGGHRCRAVQVHPESGAMTCGRASELLALLRASVADGCENVGDLEFDVPGLVRSLRAAGWRVEPPRRGMEAAS